MMSSIGWVVCIVSFFYARHVVRTHTKTQGRVIEMQSKTVGHDEIAHFAVFSFIDTKGVEHTVSSCVGSAPAQEKVGDMIPILYLPNQPESARIGSDDYVWGLTFASAVPSSIFLPLGLLLLFWSPLLKRFRKDQSIPSKLQN